VVRRETLNSPVSRSLWELENSTKDFQWSVKPFIFMVGKLLDSRCHSNHSYQHVITGAKSPFRDDFLGGILADDMGLGKSLAMLCAIIGSLDRASEFAGPIYHVGPPVKGPKAAKSTLIIVPSARECSSRIYRVV
jgi:SNF2 family DNA or RNA helicase